MSEENKANKNSSLDTEAPLPAKSCVVCSATETAQWYTGSVCKKCYRRKHRQDNLAAYAARDNAHYEANRDKVLERQTKYYENNREACKARSKAYYEEHGTQRRPGYEKEWREKNPDKVRASFARYSQRYPERVRKTQLEWAKRNASYRTAQAAKRRAAKRKAVPAWLTSAQLLEINEFYKNRPAGFDVDHIVPLTNKHVCGLHVLWNLQYLSSKENRSKNNKFDLRKDGRPKIKTKNSPASNAGGAK